MFVAVGLGAKEFDFAKFGHCSLPDKNAGGFENGLKKNLVKDRVRQLDLEEISFSITSVGGLSEQTNSWACGKYAESKFFVGADLPVQNEKKSLCAGGPEKL